MLIIIKNLAADILPDAEVTRVLRVIARQIFYDFEPYWNLTAKLRLSTADRPSHDQMDPVSGDALIYLMRQESMPVDYYGHPRTQVGFHTLDSKKRFPVGYVSVTDATEKLRVGSQVHPENHWSVTLSHEILEMIANPHMSLWVQHPHPNRRATKDVVFFQREICDPVQTEAYELDGVWVANFVLPLYFCENGHELEKVDFLGRKGLDGKRLESFGIKPDGYLPECRLDAPKFVHFGQYLGTSDDTTAALRAHALEALPESPQAPAPRQPTPSPRPKPKDRTRKPAAES